MNVFKDFIDYISKLFTWWVVIMPWEQGVRVTFGKKLEVLDEGIYLKLPLVHTVFVQEKRMRVITLPTQTLSTLDNQTITVSCSAGYIITDIGKLFNTLCHPDLTIGNIILGLISECICNNSINNLTIQKIEQYVSASMNSTDYGLKYSHVKVVNFAKVRTYRLIQDTSYMYENVDLNLKR